MEYSNKVKEILPQIIKHRRHLHSIPELSEKEFETSAYIEKTLTALGYKKINKIGTGLYVDIAGIDQTYTTALRCDIDALPIKENSGVSFSSLNGCMHACGHDGHTAILLGISELLIKQKPKTNVRLIFQFGEEGSGGAEKMINAGVLNGVDEIFAVHVNPLLEKGKMSVCFGAMFAGTVEFNIDINGKSSHCAQKELGIDSIESMRFILDKMNNANNKYKNNTLLHTGKIISGSARNIVSGNSHLECTLRFFDSAAQEDIMMNIGRILIEADNKFGTDSSLNVLAVYPPLINSAASVSKVMELCDTVTCEPMYTAEDFAFYLQKVYGCMVWIGVRDENFNSPLHSDTFGFDENALFYGAELFAKIIF